MKSFESKDFGFSAVQEYRKAIAPLKESMRRAREAMMPIFERMRELPSQVKALLSQLAERGWFLPLDFLLGLPASALDSLTKSIECESDAEIDRSIAKFYTKRLDEVLNSLITVFSERKHLFQSAFKAHKRKEYDLSIPVLLAQADGVCLYMLGVKLYSRRKGVPVTQNALTKKMGCVPVDEIVDAFFEPLRSGSALFLGPNKMKRKRERKPAYSILNRHEIMHGIDKNYGSEINSLKAIAQLDYLTYVKKFLKGREKSVA